MSARDGGISDRIDNTPQQTGMAGRQGGRAGRQGGRAGREGKQEELLFPGRPLYIMVALKSLSPLVERALPLLTLPDSTTTDW